VLGALSYCPPLMRRAVHRLRQIQGNFRAACLAALVLAGCVDVSSTSSPKPPTPSPKAAPAAPKTWLVENFESPQGSSGGFWCAFDHNGLGTKVSPDPFVLTPGGAPPTPGHFARYFGSIGDNRPPYSWAQLQVFLNQAKGPADLRGFRSVRFWAKGDGGRYAVVLSKQTVTDYDHFRQEFVATSDWTQIALPISGFAQAGWGKKLPAVFDDVTQIQFSPAGFSRQFDVSIDDVELSPDEVVLTPVAYDTSKWFAYRGTDPVKRRGSALDVSRLLDAPAGKHGPLKRQGENFVFTNGKTQRFWGVNLVASANFPTHAQADQLAELLAQLGVNMTRHHHMDAAWSTPNIFGNAVGTQKLDADALERFDYLVAALQKRGIYQFFDMLVHRHAGAEDGVKAPADVVNGFKIEGEFAPQLIDLEEKFIEQLMGHQNPYTKRSYAKDPAVALVDVINEDSLFWVQKDGEFAITSPEYRQELSKQFSVWLTKQVPGGRIALEKRWQPDAAGGQGLLANEDAAAANVDAVVLFATDDPKRLSRARAADTLRFYYDTALGYYRRIQSKLKQLGYQGLVTGSNHWVETPIDLFVNAQLDFLDRHAYWSHPSGGWGYTPEITWDPSSLLKDAGLGIVGSLGARRVKGLPYTASEWQTAAPNDYREEGVLAMGAYAALGNMSPIEFAFTHEAGKRSDAISRLSSNFDVIEQPTMLAAWPAVSLLFHRHDVAEAKQEAVLRLDDANVFDPLFRGGAPKELVRLGKTGIGFGQGQTLEQLTLLVATQIKDGVASANGGELVHDARQGTLLVNTQRTQAFAGFKPQQKVQLTNVQLELGNAFAVVIVSALDDQPLAASKHILVSALGNAVNSGMTLAPGRNRLENAGVSPVLVEPIEGRLALSGLTAGGSAKVHALGPNGERDHAVEVVTTAGGLSFGLSADHHAMHYEIVRE
jgi:Carbohydrate binding domain (family 11)